MLNELENIIKVTRTTNSVLKELASDRFSLCLDKKHFLNYKKEITYKFNKHGYRDDAWPADLKDVVWCLGDSATMGVGQTFDEAWPRMLQNKIKKRCLNIGQEGCSNDTIRMRAEFIYRNYKPKNMIVMWSYFHRRRVNGKDVHSDKSSFGVEADCKNFAYNFTQVEKLNSNVVHFIVPDAFIDFTQNKPISWEYIFTKFKLPGKEHIKKINMFTHIDFGRDSIHFGRLTSEYICGIIKKQLALTNAINQ